MTSLTADTNEELKTYPFPRDSRCPMHPPAEYRDSAPFEKARLYDGRDVWLATRYEDVQAILSSPHFSASPKTPGYPFLSAARAAQIDAYQSLIVMDAPEHTRLRRMLAKEFTAKRMYVDMRPHCEKVVNDLLDKMEAKGSPADLVEDLALPLPSLMISILLGVPYEDHEELQKWSAQRIDITLDPAVTAEAGRRMYEYVDKIVTAKESNAADTADLLDRLVIDQIRPGNLSHEEAVHMISHLYLAGHETTANQIALGTVSLMQNPEQKAALEAEPALLKSAVEEMLRFHTIVHLNSCRVATSDVQIGDQLIKKGEGVYALIHAANHDPCAFANPEQFDVRRNPTNHMAFAFGVHQCLGQQLARLELEVTFAMLFKRFPNLELAVPFEELDFKKEMFVYGLHSLPVRW